MSQHDYVLDNQAGAAFRADLNNALGAIVSQNSGATEPTTTYAFMMWVDTSVTPNLLKLRNAANSGWITVGDVTATNLGLVTAAAVAAAYAPLASPTFSGNVALSGGNLSVTGTGYSPQITLTDAATIAWNAASGQVATVTLGASRIMGAPTNLQTGAFYSLQIVQDATGSRTLTWNSIFKFTGGTAPTLSTAANARDHIVFKYNGTTLDEQGRSLGVA